MFDDFYSIYHKVHWKGMKKPDVLRVLPPPQWLNATEKTHAMYRLKKNQNKN